MTTRLEVRCCCTPTKVYGTIPVPADKLHSGAVLKFVKRTMRAPITADVPVEDITVEVVELEVATLHTPGGGQKLAVKLDDKNLTQEQKRELLATLPGFERHPPHPVWS